MDRDKLRNLWSETVGADADLDTLSVELSYGERAAIPPQSSPRAGYTVGEVLGEGGMGTVFRARQHSLERDVALKRLKDGKSRRAFDSFLCEAYAGGQLDHPNIVPVYDLGEDATGGVQLAMKLVSGRSWKSRLRERRAPLVEELQILCQVCNAVAFAASRGLVHCDLKPANVLLGDFGEVYVVDWGLAVRFGEAGKTRLRPRESIRSPTGTPLYMAPELARGDGPAVGPATDVFLLGACLYEVLTGRPPHAAERFIEVVDRAARGVLPPFPPELPAELVTICRRALASATRTPAPCARR